MSNQKRRAVQFVICGLALFSLYSTRPAQPVPLRLTLFSTDEDNHVTVVDVAPGAPPVTTFSQDITDVTLSESYGVDLTDEGDRGVVSFRGSDTVRIFDTATLSFVGSVIPMQFDPGDGTIDGSEPKQLVISHSPAEPEIPTATATATATAVAGAAPTSTQQVMDVVALPDTGGTPPDGGAGALPWLAAIVGALALSSASGGLWLAYQRRRVR
jgi:hypothetical protein